MVYYGELGKNMKFFWNKICLSGFKLFNSNSLRSETLCCHTLLWFVLAALILKFPNGFWRRVEPLYCLSKADGRQWNKRFREKMELRCLIQNPQNHQNIKKFVAGGRSDEGAVHHNHAGGHPRYHDIGEVRGGTWFRYIINERSVDFESYL